MKSNRYAGRFPGYSGKKLFEVEHRQFGSIVVAAPDENAAVLAAAKVWKTAWVAPEFYAYASARYVGRLEKNADE